MDLKPYSASKVPSKAPEHFVLFWIGLLAALSLVVDYVIFRHEGIESAVGAAAELSLLFLPFLLIWVFLRYRRLKAEKRKVAFFERLRAGLEDEDSCASTHGS
ncbi:hypothetical protein ACLBKU_15260 [Erythrobacter sp. NE805]|uniref:hypothetical protein n=1 Tax=Erythrobacter sp. NE805 TaxID=3389875 RepID=UPI00396B3724